MVYSAENNLVLAGKDEQKKRSLVLIFLPFESHLLLKLKNSHFRYAYSQLV